MSAARLSELFPAFRLETTPPQAEQTQTFHVILDTSGSMKGFVGPQCSEFKSVLDMLNRSISRVNLHNNLKCYQFGAKMSEISVRDLMTKPQEDPDFFAQGDTSIGGVLGELTKNYKASNDPKVYVLITDMVCSDANEIFEVANGLSTDFVIPEGCATSAIAWNIEFNGTVFDIHATADKAGDPPRTYKTFNKKVQRPLYLLVFGNEQGVRALTGKLVEVCEEDGKTRPQIFSPSINTLVVQEPSAMMSWDKTMDPYISVEKPEFFYGSDYTLDETGAAWAANTPIFRAYKGIGFDNDKLASAIENRGGTMTFRIPYSYINPSYNDNLAVAAHQWTGWEASNLEVVAEQVNVGSNEAVKSPMLSFGSISISYDDKQGYIATVPFTIEDPKNIAADNPVMFRVSLMAHPHFDTVNTDEALAWLKDWTMDLGVLSTQSASQFNQFGKTPYLWNLYYDRVWKFFLDDQIKKVDAMPALDCGQVVFGFVLRGRGERQWDIPSDDAAKMEKH